jgi:hypothetical protein
MYSENAPHLAYGVISVKDAFTLTSTKCKAGPVKHRTPGTDLICSGYPIFITTVPDEEWMSLSPADAERLIQKKLQLDPYRRPELGAQIPMQ